MEELLCLAGARLSVNDHHVGLYLPSCELTQADVQKARDIRRSFVADDLVFFNFADDTYVLAIRQIASVMLVLSLPPSTPQRVSCSIPLKAKCCLTKVVQRPEFRCGRTTRSTRMFAMADAFARLDELKV